MYFRPYIGMSGKLFTNDDGNQIKAYERIEPPCTACSFSNSRHPCDGRQRYAQERRACFRARRYGTPVGGARCDKHINL